MTKDLIALLDTNILVYTHDTLSPYHKKAKILCDKVWKGELLTCVAIQNLAEFFAIITNPKRATHPLPFQEAYNILREYINAREVEKITENELTQKIFLRLTKRYKPTGQKIHDIKLVATMLSWNVTVIYTADRGFKKFKEIEAMNPFE